MAKKSTTTSSKSKTSDARFRGRLRALLDIIRIPHKYGMRKSELLADVLLRQRRGPFRTKLIHYLFGACQFPPFFIEEVPDLPTISCERFNEIGHQLARMGNERLIVIDPFTHGTPEKAAASVDRDIEIVRGALGDEGVAVFIFCLLNQRSVPCWTVRLGQHVLPLHAMVLGSEEQVIEQLAANYDLLEKNLEIFMQLSTLLDQRHADMGTVVLWLHQYSARGPLFTALLMHAFGFFMRQGEQNATEELDEEWRQLRRGQELLQEGWEKLRAAQRQLAIEQDETQNTTADLITMAMCSQGKEGDVIVYYTPKGQIGN